MSSIRPLIYVIAIGLVAAILLIKPHERGSEPAVAEIPAAPAPVALPPPTERAHDGQPEWRADTTATQAADEESVASSGGSNPASAPRPTGALPRLLDLGSDKCIPCKMMAPILEELGREYSKNFSVEVIDVRKDTEAAAKYGIRIIPTQIFYDAQGAEVFRHQGFMSREDILAKWRELGVAIKARSKRCVK